jgi:anthranilate phosphoribosyltransferase
MSAQELPLASLLNQLVAGRDLTAEQMEAVMEAILSGRHGEAETAALLIGLRAKGETEVELAAAATVLRRRMVRLETGRTDLLDTCGTGGDGSGTFNISTATALVAAACGVGVVKHGNRSVSGRTGSADVLTALGVSVAGDVDKARRCLKQAGLAFCFAPHFHPALQQVMPIRRRLGVRTLFNGLGPLLNPACTSFQLLGVGHADWLDPLAGALRRLGTRRAFLVCSQDGLDEVSLSAATLVREVKDGAVIEHIWTSADFGLPAGRLADLRADTPEESAAIIRSVLEGQPGPVTDVVLANAAAALLAAEQVANLPEGVGRATEVLRQGYAVGVLERLARFSHEGVDALH